MSNNKSSKFIVKYIANALFTLYSLSLLIQ